MGKQNIQTMPYWTPSTMCNLCCRITKDQLTRDISFACCKNSFHAQLTIHSGLSITFIHHFLDKGHSRNQVNTITTNRNRVEFIQTVNIFREDFIRAEIFLLRKDFFREEISFEKRFLLRRYFFRDDFFLR